MIRAGNEKTGNQILNLPVAMAAVLTEGTMAALDEDGYAIPAVKSFGLTIAGCVQEYADNHKGEAGAAMVKVKRGAFVWNNDGTVKKTDLLKMCYVADCKTVSRNEAGSSVAGVILAVEEDGVTVDMMQTLHSETKTGGSEL